VRDCALEGGGGGARPCLFAAFPAHRLVLVIATLAATGDVHVFAKLLRVGGTLRDAALRDERVF